MSGSRVFLRLPSEKTNRKMVDRLVGSLCQESVVSLRLVSRVGLAALYLYALGEYSAAINLLEDVTKDAEYTGDESQWGAIGDCIVLLSHIEGMRDGARVASAAMEKLRNNEIVAPDRDRLELLTECLSEHEEQISVARNESPKYACEVVAGRMFEYLYFLESHIHLYSDIPADQMAELRSVIADSLQFLAEELA